MEGGGYVQNSAVNSKLVMWSDQHPKYIKTSVLELIYSYFIEASS